MAGKKKVRIGGKSKGTGRSYSRAHVNRTRKQRGSQIKRILFTILAVAIVGVTVSFLIFRSDNGLSVFENAVGTVFRPVARVFTGAATWVKGFFTDWRDYEKLEDEFDALQLENEQISLELGGLAEVELENERLTALLSAKEGYESLDPVYGKVIARDPGQWFDTFTIDRGTSDGVTEGMSVVAQGGLVGYVYEAGLTYAKVMTVIDTRSAVACLVQRTRDNGVMRGEVTESSLDAQCYVYYLPNVNNIVPGDVIVTSGTDSLYPKGLPIGEVIAVSEETSSEGSYVIVSPYVDFRHVEDVLVLRVVTRTDEELPVVATPTPAPYATQKPTPVPTNADGSTLAPDASDDAWHYPTTQPDATPAPTTGATSTPEPAVIAPLPEDDWAH